MKLLISFFLIQLAYGAAYTPKKGEGIIIGGVRIYKAEDSFDKDRSKNSNAENGVFTKNELSYFFEYGLGKRYSLIGNGGLYVLSEFESDSFNAKSTPSFGDQVIGLKKLYSESPSWLKAWHINFSFPLYSREGDLLVGNHQHNLELRHHWDFLGNWLGTFQIFELGYKLRFDQPSDELIFDYTLGKNFEPFMFFFQSFLKYGMRNHKSTNGNENTNLSADYDLLSFSLNGVYAINSKWSVQLGFTKDIWGRKVSAGDAITFNLWKKF